MKTILDNIKKKRIIQKYSPKIYTNDGALNLRTIKSISIECGVVKPCVDKSCTGYVSINCEIMDEYGGNPHEEVASIIRFVENVIWKY